MTEAPKNLAQSLRHTYVEAPQPVQAKARATQPKERSPVKEDIRQEGGEQQPQTPAKVALMHSLQPRWLDQPNGQEIRTARDREPSDAWGRGDGLEFKTLWDRSSQK